MFFKYFCFRFCAFETTLKKEKEADDFSENMNVHITNGSFCSEASREL